jgi:hypothetical protein
MRNLMYGFLAVVMVILMVFIETSEIILVLMAIGLYMLLEAALWTKKDKEGRGVE